MVKMGDQFSLEFKTGTTCHHWNVVGTTIPLRSTYFYHQQLFSAAEVATLDAALHMQTTSPNKHNTKITTTLFFSMMIFLG